MEISFGDMGRNSKVLLHQKKARGKNLLARLWDEGICSKMCNILMINFTKIKWTILF